MERDVGMFADRGNHYARTLPADFFQKQLYHCFTVVVVQMADRLVEQNKIERLAEGADDGYTLLLSEREFSGEFRLFVGYSQAAECRFNPFPAFKSGQVVFQQNVFPGGQFRE